MINVEKLSVEDRKTYDDILIKMKSFKLKKYIIRVLSEARLMNTQTAKEFNPTNPDDLRESFKAFMRILKEGGFVSAMIEQELIVYIDPAEKDLTPEQILEHRLILSGEMPGIARDYRIIDAKFGGECFAHELMSPEKLDESIENAFNDEIRKQKEKTITKIDPPTDGKLN